MRNIKRRITSFAVATILAGSLFVGQTEATTIYTVQSGDSLWKIANGHKVTVTELRIWNQLTSDTLQIGQQLFVSAPHRIYTVKSGDSISTIARDHNVLIADIKLTNNLTRDALQVGQRLNIPIKRGSYTTHQVIAGNTLTIIARDYGITLTDLRSWNQLSSDSIFIGQTLRVFAPTTPTPSSQAPTPSIPSATVSYTVKAGDSLSLIARNYSTTVEAIRSANGLTGDLIRVGQVLQIPSSTGTNGTVDRPSPVIGWPSVTHIVQAGETASSIATRFGTTTQNILRFNYMEPNDWFSAGQRIAINGFAPRNYDVVPGMHAAPARVGVLTDWFLDGQYYLKRNKNVIITDVLTGERINAKVMGGYNHSDIEPLTLTDTQRMSRWFGGSWTWTPRPVVIFVDGMNIAGSLSGMPHAQNTITGNGVTGHFDVYLLNSRSHGNTVSQTYMNQHHQAVLRASGR